MQLRTLLISSIVFLMSSNIFLLAQESESKLSKRIGNFDRVGVVEREGFGGFLLHFYTAENYDQEQKKQRETRETTANYKERVQQIDKELTALKGESGPGTLQNELLNERNQLTQKIRQDSSIQRIQLFNVKEVGADYLEVRESRNPTQSIIIPFEKIYKCYVPNKKPAQSNIVEENPQTQNGSLSKEVESSVLVFFNQNTITISASNTVEFATLREIVAALRNRARNNIIVTEKAPDALSRGDQFVELKWINYQLRILATGEIEHWVVASLLERLSHNSEYQISLSIID